MFRLMHIGSRLGFNAVKAMGNLDHQTPQDIMAEFGGAVYQKASQSTSLLNPDAAVFSECVPWDEPALQERLAEYCSLHDLGDPRDFVFVASGSVGGVFAGPSIDGVQWIVKLQYVGIREQFEKDMDALLLVNSLSSRGTKESLRQQEELFRDEFDYDREKDVLRWMGALWNTGEFASHGVRVPVVLDERCRRLPTAIAMTRMEGDVLSAYAKRHVVDEQPSQDLVAVAHQFVRFLFGTWSKGIIPADPHWGNFIVSPAGNLQVVDFGSVRKVAADTECECDFDGYVGLIRDATSPDVFVERALERHPTVFSRANATGLGELFTLFHDLLWSGTAVSFDPSVSERLREAFDKVRIDGMPGTLACARMVSYMSMMLGYMRVTLQVSDFVHEFTTG